MPISIKDKATEDAVRALAALTGESVALAVRKAAEERMHQLRRAGEPGRIAAELLEIGRRCASLPDRDRRSADDIIGYDTHGLPT